MRRGAEPVPPGNDRYAALRWFPALNIECQKEQASDAPYRRVHDASTSHDVCGCN
jgi:hypothetical protein